jgi:hypothetical protein
MLMSASATADAMGVFLSFMNFPLDLGLWMGATPAEKRMPFRASRTSCPAMWYAMPIYYQYWL